MGFRATLLLYSRAVCMYVCMQQGRQSGRAGRLATRTFRKHVCKSCMSCPVAPYQVKETMDNKAGCCLMQSNSQECPCIVCAL